MFWNHQYTIYVKMVFYPVRHIIPPLIKNQVNQHIQKHTTMRKSLILMGAAMLATVIAPAVKADDDGPKFKFTPGGRILLDGAVFMPTHGQFSDGVAIPDVRIGGSATYGNWKANVDIGYAYKSLGLKDVYLQYKFNDHNLLRAGYFVQQFGYQSSTSSSFKPMFTTPLTDSYMAATDRNIGIMYEYDKGQFLATASLIFGDQINLHANQMGKMSVGGISRLLWRPLHQDGKMAQVGISGWYQSAKHTRDADEDGKMVTSPGFFDFSCTYPTSVDNVTLLSTNVENARTVAKLSPELMLSFGRFGFESQYYYMNINRKNLPAFTAQGAYGYVRGILFGDNSYHYDSAGGGIATPNPKTLEVVAGYNYTNANSSHAGIYGGISNDISVTFNYYINKYMLCRLRYSYTNVHNSTTVPTNHVNLIEARVQFKF